MAKRLLALLLALSMVLSLLPASAFAEELPEEPTILVEAAEEQELPDPSEEPTEATAPSEEPTEATTPAEETAPPTDPQPAENPGEDPAQPAAETDASDITVLVDTAVVGEDGKAVFTVQSDALDAEYRWQSFNCQDYENAGEGASIEAFWLDMEGENTPKLIINGIDSESYAAHFRFLQYRCVITMGEEYIVSQAASVLPQAGWIPEGTSGLSGFVDYYSKAMDSNNNRVLIFGWNGYSDSYANVSMYKVTNSSGQEIPIASVTYVGKTDSIPGYPYEYRMTFVDPLPAGCYKFYDKEPGYFRSTWDFGVYDIAYQWRTEPEKIASNGTAKQFSLEVAVTGCLEYIEHEITSLKTSKVVASGKLTTTKTGDIRTGVLNFSWKEYDWGDRYKVLIKPDGRKKIANNLAEFGDEDDVVTFPGYLPSVDGWGFGNWEEYDPWHIFSLIFYDSQRTCPVWGPIMSLMMADLAKNGVCAGLAVSSAYAYSGMVSMTDLGLTGKIPSEIDSEKGAGYYCDALGMSLTDYILCCYLMETTTWDCIRNCWNSYFQSRTAIISAVKKFELTGRSMGTIFLHNSSNKRC